MCDVVVPDLLGFGASFRPDRDSSATYGVDAQASAVIRLIDELGLDRPIVGGHDIGSRVAVAVARQRPDLVRALVLTPPLAGMASGSSVPWHSRSSGICRSTSCRWRVS
jgi:pimeloyl-ACP methyl ester carboxylesterase